MTTVALPVLRDMRANTVKGWMHTVTHKIHIIEIVKGNWDTTTR